MTNGGWSGSAKMEVKAGAGGYAISAYNDNATGTFSIAFLARVDNVASHLISLDYAGAGVGAVTTNGTTTTYGTTSDARLKNVLAEQVDYRAAIKALWVGDYEFKASGTRAFGVLAQQAHGVMPYGLGVTKPANEDDQWQASSEPFGHFALWGVKDLYVMVEGFQVVVENHEGRIAALEAEVAALKARAA